MWKHSKEENMSTYQVVSKTQALARQRSSYPATRQLFCWASCSDTFEGRYISWKWWLLWYYYCHNLWSCWFGSRQVHLNHTACLHPHTTPCIIGSLVFGLHDIRKFCHHLASAVTRNEAIARVPQPDSIPPFKFSTYCAKVERGNSY